jgi:hypothetical protein
MRIYGIKDMEQEKIVYIGKTKNTNDFKPHGRHILKLFNTYPERYKYIIIEQVQEENILDEREVYYIDYYNTFTNYNCYNFTRGGSGGFTLGKYSVEERKKIKQKELKTKLNNPNIMRDTAKRARATFLMRPQEEIEKINRRRIEKSIAVRKANQLQMTFYEKECQTLKHSNTVKEIHKNRSIEQKHQINIKISNALIGDNIKLKNNITGEEEELPFSKWKKLFKVDVYHLKKGLQKTSHGWSLP